MSSKKRAPKFFFGTPFHTSINCNLYWRISIHGNSGNDGDNDHNLHE